MRRLLLSGTVGLLVVLGLTAPTASSQDASAAVVSDADECGPLVHKADGSAWECTLVEEFAGDALDRDLWTPQRTDHNGYQHGGVCVVDDDANIDVSGGTLKIHTLEQPEPFVCESPHGDYTSQHTTASVSTFDSFTQAFGRFEFRAKLTDVTVPGVHSALWMWPEDSTRYGAWPLSGEIDVAEVYTLYPDRAVPMLHYDGPMSVPGDPTGGRTNQQCLLDPTQWVTYVAEWTRDGITISYDGEVCLDHQWNPNAPLEAPQPFDQPFMLALTQGLGEGANAVNPQTPDTATMEVDWVKVWR